MLIDIQTDKLIDSLNYPLCIIDVRDYNVLLSNIMFKKIYGESNSTDKCFSITHRRKSPCTGKEHPCPLDLVKKFKKPVKVEHYHLDREGNSKVYEIHCHPILNNNQNVKQVIEYYLDITERKRVENSLKQSRRELYKNSQLLENILNTTDILIAYMDTKFNFIKVNRAYAQADDREPDYFIGHNHFDLYPNKENEEIFKQVVEEKEPYYVIAKAFEYTEHPERGISYWDWSLIPIFGDNNTVVGLVLTLQDASDRVRMQRALEKSEKKFKSITELAHGIIMRIKPDGRCTFINRSGMEFYEKLENEMLQENILDFVHPNDFNKLKSFLKRAVNEIGHIEETKVTFIVPKGIRAVEWNASSIIDDSGHVTEIQLSGRDITELQEELVEKNRLAAVGQLAAGVAHEMNSPLANISLKAEYLLDVINNKGTYLENSLLENELLNIKKEVKLCSKIVTELLQFSRKIHLNPIKLKVRTLMSELTSSPSINSRLLEKNIDVNINIKEDIEVVGDKTLLLQVFQNVINNSIDAFVNNDEKRQINITVNEKSNLLEIEVADNGVGIKKENLKRVFEPFFSTKPIGKGTGLGLSICRGIIEKHKGEIKINSNYGYGTEVHISLPKEDVL